MSGLRLKAIVTEDRQLKVNLPEDIPTGMELEIIVEHVPPRTDSEVAALLAELDTIQPQNGAEIVAWLQTQEPTGWEHIEDGGTWVAAQRRKRREKSQW